MKTVTVEELTLGNLEALVELLLALWPDCEFDEEYAQYKGIIGQNNQICFLAKSKEQYVAFIHLTIRHDYVEGAETLPIAYVEGVYVNPNHQQRGVAKLLLTHAERWAKQRNLTQIASDTELNNLDSIVFHQKVGFEEVGRIVCFVKNL